MEDDTVSFRQNGVFVVSLRMPGYCPGLAKSVQGVQLVVREHDGSHLVIV